MVLTSSPPLSVRLMVLRTRLLSSATEESETVLPPCVRTSTRTPGRLPGRLACEASARPCGSAMKRPGGSPSPPSTWYSVYSRSKRIGIRMIEPAVPVASTATIRGSHHRNPCRPYSMVT